jgi:peptide deformylase
MGSNEQNGAYIMIKPIVRDTFFLGQKAEPATKQDISIGQDLQDTLTANRDRCVGMAANMIGAKKRVIIVNVGFMNLIMCNPIILKKDTPYETEEGCISLDSVRKTTRYQNIEVEYLDSNWKKHRDRFSGWTAQIILHEMDHLEGVII